MNYGNAYVASIAVHASRGQAIKALTEADAFEGPSIVIGYAPFVPTQEERAGSKVAAERESRQSVDAGLWPLYRWDPKKGRDAPFSLDSVGDRAASLSLALAGNHCGSRRSPLGLPGSSLALVMQEKVRADIEAFLKRNSEFSLLVSPSPDPPKSMSQSRDGAALSQHKEVGRYSPTVTVPQRSWGSMPAPFIHP